MTRERTRVVVYECPASWCNEVALSIRGIEDHVNGEHDPTMLPTAEDDEI